MLIDDLILYYKLDEILGTTADDTHDNDYDATASNARVFTTEAAGILNTGADFSQGDDRIVCDTVALLRGISGITSGSFWIKTTSSVWSALVFKGNKYADGDVNAWQVILDTDGKIQLRTRDNNSLVGISSSSIVNDGAWHHVVFQFGTAGMKLWIDGSPENHDAAKTGQAGAEYDQEKGLSLGAMWRNATAEWRWFYDGIIDEVAMFEGRDMNDADAEALYNGGNALPYPLSTRKPFSKGYVF